MYDRRLSFYVAIVVPNQEPKSIYDFIDTVTMGLTMVTLVYLVMCCLVEQLRSMMILFIVIT